MKHILLYIDPGSGSMLLQFIIGAALAVTFFFKTSWLRVKSFFTKNKSSEPEA